MNGHNPKTNHQTDDFQNVIALLQELPRVSVPGDFNASLKARIATAKAESHEYADITSLLKELPRVSAPSDFDFKLRARIAQAKSEQQKASAGWFAELFGRSFSWLQASAAMAAVAIVVSVVTFGVLRDNSEVIPSNGNQVAVAPLPAPPIEHTAKNSIPVPEPTGNIQPMTVRTETAAPLKPKTIKYTPRPMSSTALPVAGSDRRLTPIDPTSVVASAITSKVMIKHQSGQSRMVNLSEYNLGLQTAHRTNTDTGAALANIF